MEQEINQQQFNQLQLTNKSQIKKLFFVGVMCSALAALVVGGIVYFVLSNSYSEKQDQLNNQVSALQNQVNTLKQEMEIAEPQSTTSQNSVSQQTTDSQSKKQTTLTKIKDNGRLVSYSGSVTVSGKYQEFYPETLLGGELCFYADNETGYLIPRDPNLWGAGNGDSRNPWFCFNNQDKAKKMFGIDDKIFSNKTIKCIQGKATVEISSYVVDKLESEVFDTANLDEIISKENYSTQCE